MGKRVFSREFKLETVKLVKERGVSKSQAPRELGIQTNGWCRQARFIAEGEKRCTIPTR
jgi:transposase-like protein